MGGMNTLYSSMLAVTLAFCFIATVAAYPRLETKDEGAESNEEASNQLLDKRIFDPIEAASSFGKFGKRYNPYRLFGLQGSKDMNSANFADIMKQVLAMKVAQQGQRAGTQKRQFDPIGYGMFARFG